MSKDEVKRLFDATANIKHKTELMMAYSCGLRVSEVASMKLKNIDSERMVVLIHQGKGRKDRQSILRAYQPKLWLFENPHRSGPIS